MRRTEVSGRETRTLNLSKYCVGGGQDGIPEIGVVETSNISVRNCTVTFSVSFVSFKTEMSVLMKFGPVTASRLRLPGGQVGRAGGTAGRTAKQKRF